MENITLLFTSLTRLWDFKMSTKANSVIINTDMKSLSGEFSDAEVEMAIRSFHATVVQKDAVPDN
jgi:hypothetical protein